MCTPGPIAGAGLDPRSEAWGARCSSWGGLGEGREMLAEGGGDLSLDLEGPSVPIGTDLVVGVFCRQGPVLALAARWLDEGSAEGKVNRRQECCPQGPDLG